MAIKLQPKQRLAAAMSISFAFFATELAVAYNTKSLALLADSFHYMNDLLSFGVAFSAIVISERKDSPPWLTFGWQRAQTLGAFFNGVFLLALGLSIFFQSIERFITIRKVENVNQILIMGCVGLTLNIISAAFLHEHPDHSHCHGPHDMPTSHNAKHDHEYGHGRSENCPERDQIQEIFEMHKPGMATKKDSSQKDTVMEKNVALNNSETCSLQTVDPHDGHHHPSCSSPQPATRDIGMLGVMIHVIGDAINNLGIIIASLFIWFLASDSRYYADPAVSVGISFMIFATALPLVKTSGAILLQSAPPDLDPAHVKDDLEKIPGIESVHELHVWRLDQRKVVASAHVILSHDCSLADFMDRSNTIRECLHAYGIHSVTLQPELGELSPPPSRSSTCCSSLLVPSSDSCGTLTTGSDLDLKAPGESGPRCNPRCRMVCGKGNCEHLTCCTAGEI